MASWNCNGKSTGKVQYCGCGKPYASGIEARWGVCYECDLQAEVAAENARIEQATAEYYHGEEV